LDADSWVITPRSFGRDFVHAVAALLLHAHNPARSFCPQLRRLVHLALISLGYLEYGTSPFVEMLSRNRGIPWYFANNFIRIDPELFSQTPLVVPAITDDIDRLKKVIAVGATDKMKKLFAFHLLGALSRSFCLPEVSPSILIEPFSSGIHSPIVPARFLRHPRSGWPNG
jgi:hypothetical protein